MSTSHNVFLFGKSSDQSLQTDAYTKLNAYARQMTNEGNECVKIWDFEKIPPINTLLSIENDFNVPIRSRAVVFTQKDSWEQSQYSKFTFIRVIDCNSEQMTPWVVPPFSLQKKLADYPKVYILEFNLNKDEKKSFDTFITLQRDILYDKGIDVIAGPYLKVVGVLSDKNALNTSNVVVVAPSYSSPTRAFNFELITPKDFSNWKYTPLI